MPRAILPIRFIMICENCGAPMRLAQDQGVMICEYCGTQAVPATDEDGVVVLEPTTHLCPVCSKPLSNATLERQDMLYCAACHGMLFEMERFPPLLEILREHRYWSCSSQSPRDSDSARTLHCPLCNGEMDEHAYGGGGNVNVDSCEKCDVIWLDRGELSRIVAAPDRDPQAEFDVYYGDRSDESRPTAARATVESAASPLRKLWPIT